MKVILDLGPLLAFFLTYALFGIYAATGVLMVATLVGLALSWKLFGKLAVMPVVTAVLVLFFGGLTVYLKDPSFIKVKPTIVYLLFAAVLAGGVLFKKPLLKHVLGEALHLPDLIWRKLSLRWAGFFVGMAVLNEAVWRNFSESTWVTFKTFGALPLTFLFVLSQAGLLKEHQAKAPEKVQ